jgi:hypothetical protein
MEAPTITTRVADLVRNPNSAMPSKWEHSVKKEQPAKKEPQEAPIKSEKNGAQTTTLNSGDKVTLSPLAMKILDDPNPAPSNWEKAREEKVERAQQLVQEKQYTLSPEAVDSIAQKIVAMLP